MCRLKCDSERANESPGTLLCVNDALEHCLAETRKDRSTPSRPRDMPCSLRAEEGDEENPADV